MASPCYTRFVNLYVAIQFIGVQSSVQQITLLYYLYDYRNNYYNNATSA